MKRFSILLGIAVISVSASFTSYGQNYKIRQSMSISGQNISSTVYVKGSRKRTESGGMMGMGADVASIEQCDLKRTVQVNDKKKLYTVEPFATEADDTPATSAKPVKAIPGKVTKGGTVTMTSTIVDTGERKQMFGLTARHIKTTMKMEPSPDACTKQGMKMETDGWYVDLPQFSCPVTIPRNPMGGMGQQPRGGCQDRIVVKYSGGGKLGFPLQLTQQMGGGDDMSFSQTLETLEFSKATLDDALFNVPADYSLANSSSDLYGKPDYSAMMRNSQGNDDSDTPRPTMSNANPVRNSLPSAKRPGVKRIGVLAPTNRSGESVSTTNLQAYLVQKLTVGSVEAVAVGSESDAKAASCDYLLSSDLSKLKQSTAGKIGGMFGKITNTDTSGVGKYDAQVDFRLVSLASGQSVLQNKASAKTESDVGRAAEGVLAQEASAVLAAAR